MTQHLRDNQDRAPRAYRAPDIQTENSCTYNRWNALAIIYGINVPFVSRLATNIRDDDGFYLWSSPRLVLTIAEAHDAYRNGNEEHQRGLMHAAIDLCNQYLPSDRRLSDDTILRLTWVQYGIASVSCEERSKQPGVFMDVVKHGVNTLILNAPKAGETDTNYTMRTEDLFTPTGTPFVKQQREERSKGDPRSPLSPNRPDRPSRRGSHGGKGGGQRGAMNY